MRCTHFEAVLFQFSSEHKQPRVFTFPYLQGGGRVPSSNSSTFRGAQGS